jgi:hypothetical protein
MLEPHQRGILGLAAHNETAEAVEGGEPVVARPGTDAGAAIILDEVNRPGAAVVLEVEKDPRRG